MNQAAGWWYFWTACFVVAGASFALIALVVAVRGVADLRKLIQILREAHHQEAGRQTPNQMP